MKNDGLLETLVRAPLLMSPKRHGAHVYFVGNLGGHFSLYRVPVEGGAPQRLLPDEVVLQSPTLMHDSLPYTLLPKSGRILLPLDKDGDEAHQPMVIPLAGGTPTPLLRRPIAQRTRLIDACTETETLYFHLRDDDDPLMGTARVRGEDVAVLGKSAHGHVLVARSLDHRFVVFGDFLGPGQRLLTWRDLETDERHEIRCGDMRGGHVLSDGTILILAAQPVDTYSPALLDPRTKTQTSVTVTGIRHTGFGEMTALTHVDGDTFAAEYNIDGVSWAYRARFARDQGVLQLDDVVCGEGDLAGGVLQSLDLKSGALSFSSATKASSIQVPGLGAKLPDDLVAGEDASFTSHDGLRISARLYRPHPSLGFQGARPVVFYIHGGPQSQERPDFTWFSMPMIQWLARQGIAVFVPNVRGSTGYGASYTRRVVGDWGGQDRLDHVHALSVLARDPGIDTKRAGVMGRSYGGYMTLTLACRHPDLFKAACDMFGPYHLIDTFYENLPPVSRTFFKWMMGDPETELGRRLLIERSPATYSDALKIPLLVVQGRNDPRVREEESSALVADLKRRGKKIDYLLFDDEGHDVSKDANRIVCFSRIASFFAAAL